MTTNLPAIQLATRSVLFATLKQFYKEASKDDSNKIFMFLRAITRSNDPQDLRLSICLTIDLLNRNVKPEKIWFILTHLNSDLSVYNSDSVSCYFFNACKQIEDKDITINTTAHCDNPILDTPYVTQEYTYVRIIPLASYIKRELINHPEFAYETNRKFNDRLGLGPVDKPKPNTFNEALKSFDWTTYFLNTNIAIPFRGNEDDPEPVYIKTGKRFSWLVRLEELSGKTDKLVDADTIADRLGLIISNDPEEPTTYQIYISLSMPGPPPVKNVGYQPAAIHAGWRTPNLFISSEGNDGWGLTFPVNNQQPLKERILLEFNAAEKDANPIKGNVIGLLKRPRDPDNTNVDVMGKVLLETINRLKSILKNI